jgi:hypothetical protein
MDIKIGHQVLVERHGQLVYEPVLAFLHILPSLGHSSQFIEVKHESGTFRASSGHIVFVLDTSGKTASKQVIQLGVGDNLLMGFLGGDGEIKPSRVLQLRRGSGQSGMYAPWTDSGKVVVDGVIASTYASPSVHQALTHELAHGFHFPLRLYHSLGLPAWLQPFWDKLCSPKPESNPRWFCQGGNTAPEATLEEMHPYIAFAFKALHLDWFLSSQ